MTIEINICILVTFYNNYDELERCLSRIKGQKGVSNILISTYVLDDGSDVLMNTDGLLEKYDINLFRSSGGCYWCRGMSYLFDQIDTSIFSHFLLLNSDTFLDYGAISNLITSECFFKENTGAIVGTVLDGKSISYGGRISSSSLFPTRLKTISPSLTECKPCDTFNANVVLIPKIIIDKIGFLDPVYWHSLGDFDLGFRISKTFNIFLAPGFLGECKVNQLEVCNFSLSKGSVLDSIKSICTHPKGIRLKDFFIYNSRHAGVFWLPLFFVVYIKYIVISIFNRYK
jgi:GT2 family glycosyltransferase